MAATSTLLIPSVAILLLILLSPNPTTSDAAANETASKSCDGGLENCRVGDLDSDSEFLMETETSRMLLDFQGFETDNSNNANRQSVGECERPPRYDSCLGEKRSNPKPENCDTRNRQNPC